MLRACVAAVAPSFLALCDCHGLCGAFTPYTPPRITSLGCTAALLCEYIRCAVRHGQANTGCSRVLSGCSNPTLDRRQWLPTKVVTVVQAHCSLIFMRLAQTMT